MHEYDNRYLWMNLKRIMGSHFANYREAWEANDLIVRGLIHPTLSKATPWRTSARRRTTSTTTCTRARSASSCLAPEEGLGVRDPEMRERRCRDQPVPRRLTAVRRSRVGSAGAGLGSRRTQCCSDGADYRLRHREALRDQQPRATQA